MECRKKIFLYFLESHPRFRYLLNGGCLCIFGGLQLVMGVPQASNGWFSSGKISSFEMDNDWGYPYDSGNLHLCISYHGIYTPQSVTRKSTRDVVLYPWFTQQCKPRIHKPRIVSFIPFEKKMLIFYCFWRAWPPNINKYNKWARVYESGAGVANRGDFHIGYNPPWDATRPPVMLA